MARKLILRSLSAPYLVFAVSQEPRILGRAYDCDFVVDHPLVSRRHVVVAVAPDGNGMRMVDVDSSNGTFVDDRRVESAEVSSGQRVRFGKIVFEGYIRAAC